MLTKIVLLIAVFKSQKVEMECEEAMRDTFLKSLPIGSILFPFIFPVVAVL